MHQIPPAFSPFGRTIVPMVAESPSQLIGRGIYSPSEASFYARVKTQTFNRWLYGNKQGQPVLTPERGESRDVSFLDFVQVLGVRAVQSVPTGNRVSLQKIREAVSEAQDKYGVSHPLAMRHCIYVFGSEIVIQVEEGDYRALTGKTAGNRLITKVVQLYLENIDFGQSSRMAERFTAWPVGDHKIVLDPKVRFGEPMLPELGYTARTLWEAATSEGSIEAASEALGVPTEAVIASCQYFDHLQGAP